MIILTVTPIKNFDKQNYNYIRCPRKHILGLKHRSTIARIAPLQEGAEANKEGLLIICPHCCNTPYLITIEENITQYIENL